jgi:hypothetical protein
MNPAAEQPGETDYSSRRYGREETMEKLTPISHSYLEPGNEGIVFAVICLLASAIIYGGVLLIRFLT